PRRAHQNFNLHIPPKVHQQQITSTFFRFFPKFFSAFFASRLRNWHAACYRRAPRPDRTATRDNRASTARDNRARRA
ncbi:MAG: hypothetical protein RML32_10315, partial [Gammaproteobacteria bacterium]|nr:hypothetical protein [Gammaproteobacteria bacterium]